MALAGKPDMPITYRDLLEGAWGYAATLERRGVQPGEVIILILQHSLELVYAYWGAVLRGAIPSIMPFLTEKLLPERYRADLASLVSITARKPFSPTASLNPRCRRRWQAARLCAR